MATTYRPDNSIYKNNQTGFGLASGDQLIVDPGIVIASNVSGVSASDGNSVICNGTIFGSYGIDFEQDGSLTVGTSGTVSSDDTGLLSYGAFNAVNNGFIFGGQIAVQIYGTTNFTNNGTIRKGSAATSYETAIYLGSSHTSAKIVNNGLIDTKQARGFAIFTYDGNTAPDTIINRGTMKGNVSLNGGADVFDNLKGRVYGTIDTGAGADKITGGAYADTMTGGADKDIFYFKTKPSASAVDHITDFEHNKDDIALSKALFKLEPGQSVASALQDITAGFDKQGSNKHILYNHDTGWLYYDADGKGGAAPIHFATLDTHPTISSGDIVMV